GAAPDGSFRSFDKQTEIYNQGRTTPGKIVTHARAGESYHNYGLAADIAFNTANGGIAWPEKGDYAKMWSRYGEIAKQQGLRWGGDWKRGTDRPHVEYHPGIGDGDAARLKAAHARGGNEGSWDQLGIGARP